MVTSSRGFNKIKHRRSSRAAPGISQMLKRSHTNPHLSKVRADFGNACPLNQHGSVATASMAFALVLTQPWIQPPFLKGSLKAPCQAGHRHKDVSLRGSPDLTGTQGRPA